MGSFCVQKHPTNLTNHRYLKDNRRNDTLPFPSNIPPITIQTNTLYFDDLRIDDWSSILMSSILSISTIYIDDPNIICLCLFYLYYDFHDKETMAMMMMTLIWINTLLLLGLQNQLSYLATYYRTGSSSKSIMK